MDLVGALFVGRAGVPLSHIPYRGGGPAMNGVMAGQVPLFFANVAAATFCQDQRTLWAEVVRERKISVG